MKKGSLVEEAERKRRAEQLEKALEEAKKTWVKKNPSNGGRTDTKP